LILQVRAGLLFPIILFFGLNNLVAQKQTDRRISYSFENKSLTKILFELSEAHELKFYFDPSEMPTFPLSGTYKETQVYLIIQNLLNGTRLKVIPYKEEGIIIIDKDKLTKESVAAIVENWNSGTFKYPIKDDVKNVAFSFGDKMDRAQEKLSIQINIFDENSLEPLIGAFLINQDLSVGENSDANGQFLFSLPAGTYEFNIEYTGYQKINLSLDLYDKAKIELPIGIQAFLFDEVEVLANSLEQKMESAKAGVEKLSIEELSNIPQVTGDIDILKSIEILPGVTSTTELSQGFNIRGGSTDQNLILLNDGIIFNPTHIVGFISAFNPDVISEANLYKGFVDASLGGRLSGVLDIKTNTKGAAKWTGKGGVGISMMKLSTSGKIGDRANVVLAARGSFNDYLLGQIANVELQRSNANFYDLNANINFDLTENHRLFFNNYLSSDFFEYNDQFGFEWKNHHSGLQLKSNWKNGIYSSLSLNFGQYHSENFTLNSPDAFRFSTGLNYYKALFKVDKELKKDGYLRIGIEYLEIENKEDRLVPEENSTIQGSEIQRNGAANLAPFISISSKLSDKLKFEVGLRMSLLKGLPYASLEPRFSMSYQPERHWSLKASYNRMSQFINQFSNTNNVLPSDIWVLTNEAIRPSLMDQYSIGGVHLNNSKSFEWALDLFYKDFKNLYELDDFAQIILNTELENVLLDAEGKSYGIEAQIKKKKGKWQGSLAYTYSRSFRKVVDDNIVINRGEYFPAAFDIPHQLNILAVYKWLPVVSFNFAYIFRSGPPTTAPNASFIQDGFLVPLYSERNGERIGYYSRLDFSVNLDLRKSKDKGFRSSFTLGFYNLLGRNNPTNVFFRRSKLGNIVPFQFSVVGSVVPNFSWNFVF